MLIPRQRLIQSINLCFCDACDGRGFLIIEKNSPDGRILPNEIKECEVCDGTGKHKNNQT